MSHFKKLYGRRIKKIEQKFGRPLEDMLTENFGKKTQAIQAKEFGVHPSHISMWCRKLGLKGKRGRPRKCPIKI